VWSYGEEAYGILTRHIFLRERMRPYIRRLMAEASRKGTPVMRPLFYDFPADPAAWEAENQYMFGPDLLVAPVMYPGMRKRSLYLPRGARWKDSGTGELHEGGKTIDVDAPLDVIPVFLRDGADVLTGS